MLCLPTSTSLRFRVECFIDVVSRCRRCPGALAVGQCTAQPLVLVGVGPTRGALGLPHLKAFNISTSTAQAVLKPPLLLKMLATMNGTCSLQTGVLQPLLTRPVDLDG